MLKTRTSEKNGEIPWIEAAAGTVIVVPPAGAAASAAIAAGRTAKRSEKRKREVRVGGEFRMVGSVWKRRQNRSGVTQIACILRAAKPKPVPEVRVKISDDFAILDLSRRPSELGSRRYEISATVGVEPGASELRRPVNRSIASDGFAGGPPEESARTARTDVRFAAAGARIEPGLGSVSSSSLGSAPPPRVHSPESSPGSRAGGVFSPCVAGTSWKF